MLRAVYDHSFLLRRLYILNLRLCAAYSAPSTASLAPSALLLQVRIFLSQSLTENSLHMSVLRPYGML